MTYAVPANATDRGDEQHREPRRRSKLAAITRNTPTPITAVGEHRVARHPLLHREQGRRPRSRGPMPSAVIKMPNCELPPSTSSANTAPSGTIAPAPMIPPAEADHHRPHQPVGADEPEPFDDLAEGLRSSRRAVSPDRSGFGSGSRQMSSAEARKLSPSTQSASASRFDVEGRHRVEPAEPVRQHREGRGDRRGQREGAVRRDESERVRRRELLVGNEVRQRRVLRRAPQQREHLERRTRRSRARPGRRRTAGPRGASPDRRRRRPSPCGGRSDRRSRHRPWRGRSRGPCARRRRGSPPPRSRRRSASAMREDGEEPDPVAQAREALREPEPEERARAEHPPRRSRQRGRPGRRGNERRLVAGHRGSAYWPGPAADRLRRRRCDGQEASSSVSGGASSTHRRRRFAARLLGRRLLGRPSSSSSWRSSSSPSSWPSSSASPVFFAGPRAARSRSSSTASSRVSAVGSIPLRTVALVVPSVTYGPKRPSSTRTRRTRIRVRPELGEGRLGLLAPALLGLGEDRLGGSRG